MELEIKRFSPETSVRLGFMSAALFGIDSIVLYYDEVLIGFIGSILLPECDPSCHCFDSILQVINEYKKYLSIHVRHIWLYFCYMNY